MINVFNFLLKKDRDHKNVEPRIIKISGEKKDSLFSFIDSKNEKSTCLTISSFIFTNSAAVILHEIKFNGDAPFDKSFVLKRSSKI